MARGPAYPFVDLEEAVELARRMYQYTRRSPADANAIIREAWNYSPTSSSSSKIVAALKYFGLIEEGESSGDVKTVRLTDRSYRILVDDPSSPERQQALRDAALSPKAYLMCWTRWGREMPPSMRSNLIFGEGFIESTIDKFLQDYKRSIEFAGLLNDLGEQTLEEQIPVAKEAPVSEAAHSKSAPVAGALASIGNLDNRSDVFSLNEGTVSLSWPKNLSEESFQDLSDWLDLVKRKIERTIVRQAQ